MKGTKTYLLRAAVLLVVCSVIVLTGCSEDDCTCPIPSGDEPGAPAGLATVTFADQSVTLWSYTGISFDGEPVDPVNLVFVGQADPLQIRAALLALDGDRTAFGFPDAYPFNASWGDAIGGDVQTAYARQGDGWLGSVVQLQLGDYEPVRVHLRLFRTDHAFGEDGIWTLGGAHFEVMITGTADHQVLSWELAEQVVVADLMRSGLLDASTPTGSTGVISAAPSFREIAPEIYNALPVELKFLIEGPLDEQADPVPIVSDGTATILHLAGVAPPSTGASWSTVTIHYDQYVPKPFCSDGPYDWLYVSGPIDFSLCVNVGADGGYTYSSEYWGTLEATTVDMSGGVPQLVGEPFPVLVNGAQGGALSDEDAWVHSESRRLAQRDGGSESQVTRLDVNAGGAKSYGTEMQCLSEATVYAGDEFQELRRKPGRMRSEAHSINEDR